MREILKRESYGVIFLIGAGVFWSLRIEQNNHIFLMDFVGRNYISGDPFGVLKLFCLETMILLPGKLFSSLSLTCI